MMAEVMCAFALRIWCNLAPRLSYLLLTSHIRNNNCNSGGVNVRILSLSYYF